MDPAGESKIPSYVFLQKMNLYHTPAQGRTQKLQKSPCGTLYLHCSRLLRYLYASRPHILLRRGNEGFTLIRLSAKDGLV